MEYGILAGIVGFAVGFFIGVWAVYKIVDLVDKYKDIDKYKEHEN